MSYWGLMGGHVGSGVLFDVLVVEAREVWSRLSRDVVVRNRQAFGYLGGALTCWTMSLYFSMIAALWIPFTTVLPGRTLEPGQGGNSYAPSQLGSAISPLALQS